MCFSGTCAATLPQLDSELAYFKQGLDWNDRFNLKNILAQNGIVPGSTYDLQHISDAIKSATNADPVIQCVVERSTKVALISSIEICFDKNLNPADCDSVSGRRKGAALGNCGINQGVTYPDKVEMGDNDTDDWGLDVDSLNHQLESYYRVQNRLINIYNSIRMIIWATL